MSLCRSCRRLLRFPERYVTSGEALRSLVEPRSQWRTVGFLPSMADKVTSSPQKMKDYREEKILGYTAEQVYNVVADVDSYRSFLPWCQESFYHSSSVATLTIGFPPLVERYTATVVTEPPHSIKTMSNDGKLFSKLENSWYFRPGPDLESGPTCLVNFRVVFEFRSLFYARLGFLVFDEVARTMAGTFESRCGELYGADHLRARGVKGINGLKQLLEESKSQQIRKHGELMETE